VMSLSLKVEEASGVAYTWEAAFWPCWGLEGIIILVVVLLLPVCVVSAFVDRPKFVMLTWVVLSGAGLGLATFTTMYNIALLLDNHLCPNPPYDSTKSPQYLACAEKLATSMWPWLAFLPCFAFFTLVLKRRLATSLHESWYQAAPAGLEEGGGGIMGRLRSTATVPLEELPPPAIMFRITPTYFSRACDPMAYYEGDFNSPGREAGAVSNSSFTGDALTSSNAGGLSRVLASGCGAGTPSMGSYRRSRAQQQSLVGSTVSRASRHSSHMSSTQSRSLGVVDPCTSILSARGTTFTEIVESENLCFVCYDQSPDSCLLECGHAGLCVGCASRLLERRRPGSHAFCPICRTAVSCVLQLRPDLAVPSELFSSQAPNGNDRHVVGPPWPNAAKRTAVVVEVARRAAGRPSSGWRLFFPRQ